MSLHVVDGRWRRVAYQAVVLPGRELGLFVKGVGVLGHVLHFGEREVLLGEQVVYGLWVLGRDVVDLGEVFLLQRGCSVSQSGRDFCRHVAQIEKAWVS